MRRRAPRRARRRRPQPFGVHARRPGRGRCRPTRSSRSATAVAGRVSHRRTCRRAPAPRRARRRAVRRARGGDDARAAAALDARAFGVWWSETLRGTGVLLRRRRRAEPRPSVGASRRIRCAAARLRAAGSASRARRDGGGRAPPSSRSTASSRPTTLRLPRAIATRGARARRWRARRARARVPARASRTRAGVDERDRPGARRDRGRVHGGARTTRNAARTDGRRRRARRARARGRARPLQPRVPRVERTRAARRRSRRGFAAVRGSED